MPKTKETKKDNALIARRPLLDDFKKFEMLAVLIRNRAAYIAASEILEVSHVEAMGVPYALVWKVVRRFFKKHKMLPKREMLRTEIHNELGDHDDLDEDERKEIDAFISYAYSKKKHGGANLSKDKLYADTALDTCKQYLEEQFALDLRESVYNNGEVPVEFPLLLAEHTGRMTRLQSLTQPGIEKLFTKGWEAEAPPVLRSIGVSILDVFMGGGVADDECVLFMGPYGSCKTTVGVQAAVTMAKDAAGLYDSGETPGGMQPTVVFISTEMRRTEMRLRALSCLSKVPRKRLRELLEKDRSLNGLSRSKTPAASKGTAYEKKFYFDEKTSANYLPEFERVQMAMRILNDHLLFVECVSGGKTPNLGMGGVPEIAAVVEAEMRKHKKIAPYAFVLDHASALAARMMQGDKYSLDDERKILKWMPLQCQDYLIYPHRAPLLLLHQLSGEANSRAPTADLSHTDASECKSIGEYAAFAVVTGNPTQDDNQLTKWRCTKHRREPPKPHAIVQVDGRFCRVVDRSDEFVCDVGSRMIVSKDEMASAKKYAKHSGDHGDDVSGVNG